MADRRTSSRPQPGSSANGAVREEVQETVTVGNTPPTPHTPGQPGQTVDVRASIGREYVAATTYGWYVNMPRALPWEIDDLTVDFGDDVYETMMLDSQVRANVNIYKAAIIEDGPTLNPAIVDKDDPQYELSRQITLDVERMFAEMTTPLDDVLWDMLDCIALGNRLAEQVYRQGAARSGKTQFLLDKLAVKPRDSVAFVVDSYMAVVGILGRIPGQPFGVQRGILLADIKHAENLLPRAKFAVMTFRPKNGDPRGTSLLRAAYDPWNMKMQLKREFLKYLTQFATPSLVAYTPPEAQSYFLTDASGNIILDGNGNPTMRTPEQDMLGALQQFANGQAVVMPNGSEVQPIETRGEGRAFLDAFAWFDQQIAKSILHQTLATEEGEHQARAASSTHKDVLDTIIRQSKRMVDRMLNHDLIRTYILLNYGEAMLDLAPTCTVNRPEAEDTAQLWSAAAQLMGTSFLHESQLQAMDSRLGLPVRDEPKPGLPMREEVLITEQQQPDGANSAQNDPAGGQKSSSGASTPPSKSKGTS